MRLQRIFDMVERRNLFDPQQAENKGRVVDPLRPS